MASLTDVARVAGVSLTTASMVLNKGKQHNRVSAACAARVQEVARQLGYVPNYHARSMKLGKAEVLAVAMDAGHEDERARIELELNNPYFGFMLGGIEQQTRSLGYLMTLVGPGARVRAPDRALLGIRQRRFDGMIVPGALVQTQLTQFLDEPVELPIVVIEPPKDTVHASVVFDQHAAISLAVQHLAELGHRHLLYVGEFGNLRHADARGRSCQAECQRLGIAFDRVDLRPSSPEVFRLPDIQITEYAAQFGQFIRTSGPMFTGVVCYNDITALGVMEALREASYSVPKDVSVIGFDDTLARYASPRLTTVSHELTEMGRLATDLCMEMVNNPQMINEYRGTRSVVRARLIQRSSCSTPGRGVLR